jgi:PHD/YefM family antitoxin component YafN of YafNO toxin-antitoxin module
VEAQRAPEDIVHTVVTADLTERIATLQQTVLSQSRLQPMLERSRLAQPGQEMGDLIDKIRTNMSVEAAETDLSEIGVARDKASNEGSPFPGFYVMYTASTAHEGQQTCNELTSLLLEENLKSREDVARGTIDFLNRELDDTRRNVETMDAKFLERSKGHDSRSLESEEKYRMLMFEDEIEKKSYTDLLSKLSQAQALLEPDAKWNQHQTEDENRRKD